MKLKLPAPIEIAGPSGETIRVSATEVLEHVVKTGRELGASSLIDQVRAGGRILAAVAAGSAEQTADIPADDIEVLKRALSNPSRGWMAIDIDVSVPLNNGQTRTVKRAFIPRGIDLLPLIDGLLAN